MKQQQVGRLHARNAGALAQRGLRDLAVAGSILFALGFAPAPSDDASAYAQHETIKMGYWALTPRLAACSIEPFFSVSQVSTKPCLQQYLGRYWPDMPRCLIVVGSLRCCTAFILMACARAGAYVASPTKCSAFEVFEAALQFLLSALDFTQISSEWSSKLLLNVHLFSRMEHVL